MKIYERYLNSNFQGRRCPAAAPAPWCRARACDFHIAARRLHRRTPRQQLAATDLAATTCTPVPARRPCKARQSWPALRISRSERMHAHRRGPANGFANGTRGGRLGNMRNWYPAQRRRYHRPSYVTSQSTQRTQHQQLATPSQTAPLSLPMSARARAREGTKRQGKWLMSRSAPPQRCTRRQATIPNARTLRGEGQRPGTTRHADETNPRHEQDSTGTCITSSRAATRRQQRHPTATTARRR